MQRWQVRARADALAEQVAALEVAEAAANERARAAEASVESAQAALEEAAVPDQ